MRSKIIGIITAFIPFLGVHANESIYLGNPETASEPQFEVLTLKSDTNTLGYVLALLDIHGFTVLSVSCISLEEPRWTVNYCQTRWSLPGQISM
jgi:hypothetical protein